MKEVTQQELDYVLYGVGERISSRYREMQVVRSLNVAQYKEADIPVGLIGTLPLDGSMHKAWNRYKFLFTALMRHDLRTCSTILGESEKFLSEVLDGHRLQIQKRIYLEWCSDLLDKQQAILDAKQTGT